jgi:tetratricopeptide (TPR) repeat protein
MTDDMNLVDYSAAAIQTGRLDLAEPLLERALARYTDRRPVVRLNLASLFMQKAIREATRNRADLAEAYADRGLKLIADVPETDPLIERQLHRLIHAFLLGIRASVFNARGKTSEAIRTIDEGLAIMEMIPDNPAPVDPRSRAGSHAFLLTTKAAVLEASGDRKTAGALFLEAARLYPGDRHVPEWLAGARRCGVSTKSTSIYPSGWK